MKEEEKKYLYYFLKARRFNNFQGIVQYLEVPKASLVNRFVIFKIGQHVYNRYLYDYI